MKNFIIALAGNDHFLARQDLRGEAGAGLDLKKEVALVPKRIITAVNQGQGVGVNQGQGIGVNQGQGVGVGVNQG